MNPRIYYKAPNYNGSQPTSAHKQWHYRRCVALGKKLGKKLTMKQYRAIQEKMVDRMFAFMRKKDYETAKVAFKQAMQEFHPDHGGDPESATRIICAWDEYKKRNGWSGPAPSVTGTK